VLGKALLEQGKLSEAETSLRRALELLGESDGRRTEVERNLSECQNRLDAEGEKPGKPPGG
jgi:hypothetical protein